MHEILVIFHKIQNASLFLWASKTLKLDPPNVGHELFMEYELDDLQISIFHVNGSFHPEFGFLFQAITQLLCIMANEIGLACLRGLVHHHSQPEKSLLYRYGFETD